MSVEVGIHKRWATFRPLTDVVPAERFITGWVPPIDGSAKPTELPFVSLTREGDPETGRVSGGVLLTTMTMRFSVWSGSLSEAKAISDNIMSLYGRESFTYPSGGIVQDMMRINRIENIDEDGVWNVSHDYRVLTQEKE